jgi:hypothetical protein
MAVTPLPFLDRTAATFKNDVDAFFATKLPTFSVQVNQVATDAQSAADAANTSKNAAGTSATNAKTSETNAANSASAANTSKSNAATSATNAADSATAANTSKNAAANSATAAATSATNSESSAVRAKQAADSISSGPVTSVNSKTGVVTLNKADLGLSLVDNLSVFARGMTASPSVLSIVGNMDDYLTLTNGWYGVGPTSAGAKPPGETWGSLFVAGRAFQSDARVNQFFFSESTTRVWLRRNSGGSWSGYRELTRPLPGSSGIRKPLVGSADGVNDEWSNILSIANYLDKSFTGTAAAAQTLDVSVYSIFDFLLAAATTFSFANVPSLAGETITVVVRIRQDSTARLITWPSNITWLTPQGISPQTPTVGQIVEYIFSTVGSPANWYGRVGAST